MTETALDAAFQQMQTGGEAEGLRFYRLLADAPLCLLLTREAEGDRVDPQVFDLTDGPVLLAFDSEERLAGFQEGPVPYVSLPGRVIAGLMLGQGGGMGGGLWMGLNLGTGAASETLLPPEAMANLVQLLDVAPQEVEGRAQQFRSPHVPDTLDASLRFALRGAEGLAGGAVLAGVSYQGGARGHLLALVGATEAAHPALARMIAEALSFAGLEAGALDVVFLDPGDAALSAMAQVGRSYEIALPRTPEAPVTPAPPGAPTPQGRQDCAD